MKFSSLPALQVPNLKIIQGSVKAIDCQRKIAIIKTKDRETGEGYDFLIAASGLKRVFPVVPQSLTKEEYLEEAGNQISAIRDSKEAVVVIGGGKFSP